jgi:hypothetical protein
VSLTLWLALLVLAEHIVVLGLGFALGRNRAAAKRCVSLATLLAAGSTLAFAILGQQPVVYDWLYKLLN